MKLYYFDFVGRSESIKLLLTHANVKFEDIRIKQEDWPRYKEKFELKQVPALEDNGQKFCQTYAILEYLGAKYGYLPKNYEKMYNVLFVMNIVEDLFGRAFMAMNPLSPYDEKAKAEAFKRLVKTEGPLFLGALESQLKQNSSQDFIVGNKYTIADFFIIGIYPHILANEEWKKVYHEKIPGMYPTLYTYIEKRAKDFNPYYKRCKTKLYYFDTPGRAEMVRVMLKYLNLPFEDIRIKFEDWPKHKTSGKFPFQQLPMIECEPCGVRLCQADAIMHRIGARYGLIPKDKPEELYSVVWWCNSLKDLMDGCARTFLSLPEDKKKKSRTEFFEKNVVNVFQAMENKLKLKKACNYLVGDKYTIADFYFVGVWRGFVMNPMFSEFKGIVEKYPLLNEYFDKKNKLSQNDLLIHYHDYWLNYTYMLIQIQSVCKHQRRF
eukprot:TRINITY_DN10612_c0_g2_i1.p2 TRINITY_DN10612_c0_g2~~TRINITY_DN10612_c0_g2_i1.p2  ORF type:complete len:435 (+),score=56.53 TRINITY_DN10612_c0_g2_i1:319-1623(+)